MVICVYVYDGTNCCKQFLLVISLWFPLYNCHTYSIKLISYMGIGNVAMQPIKNREKPNTSNSLVLTLHVIFGNSTICITIYI